jgi:transposase
MRKSTDGLCLLIADVLKMNPTEGHLFLFRSRDKNKLKALCYEPNCFTLYYRRLAKGRYISPKNSERMIEMSWEHLRWILASDKFRSFEVRDKNTRILFKLIINFTLKNLVKLR